MSSGILYLVPTPIGNMGDMTFRGVDILRSVTLIAAEDTRHTRKLLKHYEVQTACISYHKFNERQQCTTLVKRMKDGESIAIVTDAGTPGISDPAAIIVRDAIQAGIRVECLPGATALIPALATAGLDCDRFLFIGFLPSKSGERVKLLQSLNRQPFTLIFYVPPHKFKDIMIDAAGVFGNRRCVIAREISKIHEDYRRGRLTDLAGEDLECRGEIVLLVEGYHPVPPSEQELEDMLHQDDLKRASLNDLAAEYHNLTGVPRNRIKQMILALKDE